MLCEPNQRPTKFLESFRAAAARAAVGANHPTPDAARSGVSAVASGPASCSLNRTAAGGSKARQGRATVAPDGAAGRGQNGPLGIQGKTVDQIADPEAVKVNKRRALRSQRFKLQRHAAKLAPAESVAGCKWRLQRQDGQTPRVGVMLSPDGRAFYAGLQTCGSPWLCPVCSAKISEIRRGEMNHGLGVARALGLIPVMITLTHRHDRADALDEQLRAMKKAKQRLRQRREWRALKPRIAGTITATEVTHGESGWHTHFHEIALVQADSEEEAVALFEPLGRVWLTCLGGFGLNGALPHAWQVQGAARVGDYVAKWGAAEELAMSRHKQGKKGGRNPWQLLTASAEGDAVAGALWQEYARAFKGARQLVWSPGLRAAFGLDAAADGDAAEAEEPAQALALFSRDDWVRHDPAKLGIRYRRGRVLNAAEERGAAGVAEVAVENGDEDGLTLEQLALEIIGLPPVEVLEDDDPDGWDEHLPSLTPLEWPVSPADAPDDEVKPGERGEVAGGVGGEAENLEKVGHGACSDCCPSANTGGDSPDVCWPVEGSPDGSHSTEAGATPAAPAPHIASGQDARRVCDDDERGTQRGGASSSGSDASRGRGG